jgi:spore coat polysaccharide biosynthesis protein SpsF (cytidylyltransferase family)
LFAPDVAREVIQLYCRAGGIATNDTTCSGWPDGVDVEVFTAFDLAEAARSATDGDDREHVTPWIRRKGPHSVLRCGENLSFVKISVDYEADLAIVEQVYRETGGDTSWAATRRGLADYVAIAQNVLKSLPKYHWPRPDDQRSVERRLKASLAAARGSEALKEV